MFIQLGSFVCVLDSVARIGINIEHTGTLAHQHTHTYTHVITFNEPPELRQLTTSYLIFSDVEKSIHLENHMK